MLPAASTKSGNVAILGKVTLREIWIDLHKTDYLSLMKKPRSTVGQMGWAKWRLQSSNHLRLQRSPLFIHGVNSLQTANIEKMLDHFLLLVDVITTVKLFCETLALGHGHCVCILMVVFSSGQSQQTMHWLTMSWLMGLAGSLMDSSEKQRTSAALTIV